MKVVVNYVQWLVLVAFVCGALSYGMLSRSSIRKLRTALFYGIVTAVPVSFAMISAVFPVWLAVVSLLASIAVIVWNMMWWHKATLADRRSLRLRSAVCATGLNVFLFWPMTRAFDAFRRIPVVGVFQTQIAAIIAISAICFVWMTYFKRKRYRRRWTVTGIIWGILVTLAIISLLMSAVNAVPKSKSAKAKAAVETVDGQGPIDAIKELFGKLLGSSDEEVAPDDESSVAAEAESDDESVAAEVAEESVVTEADENGTKKEAKEEAKAATEEVVEVKWGTYERVIKGHPEFTIYNFPLTTDDDPDNNSYFGPNILSQDKTKSDYWRTIKAMMEEDPFILAEAISTADQIRHTDLCGDYYNGDNAEWAKAINLMVGDFFNKPGTFVNLSEKFLDMLNNETRELDLIQSEDVIDQYYLDIYTREGIPHVVVAETHQSGDILIAWLRTKGGDPQNDVGLGFRLQCCNVCAVFRRDGTVTPISKEMNIPTEEVPEMPKGYDPPEPTKAPTPTPVPPTPTPVPGGGSDPEKDPNKTPNKQSESNNDSGKGDDTNSGKGSTKSAAASESQKASDSGSVQDYDSKVEQNRSANAGGSSSGGSGGSGSGSSGGQKSGGESNKPSQSASGAKQDNNGDAGNGSGSIDKPTAKSETAASADTNQSVDASGSAGGIIGTPD